jgi:hypothetical protein
MFAFETKLRFSRLFHVSTLDFVYRLQCEPYSNDLNGNENQETWDRAPPHASREKEGTINAFTIRNEEKT